MWLTLIKTVNRGITRQYIHVSTIKLWIFPLAMLYKGGPAATQIAGSNPQLVQQVLERIDCGDL